MYAFLLILQNAVCSSMFVRHSTIKVTAISITVIVIILQSLHNLVLSLALIIHFSES